MNSEILAQLLTNLLGMLKAKDNDNRFILGKVMFMPHSLLLKLFALLDNLARRMNMY